MKKITYITGNEYKVVGAKGFLEPLGFGVEAKNIDCPEIQADTMEEVAKFSSHWIHNRNVYRLPRGCRNVLLGTLRQPPLIFLAGFASYAGPLLNYPHLFMPETLILRTHFKGLSCRIVG